MCVYIYIFFKKKINIGEDVDRLEPSYIAGRNANGVTTVGNSSVKREKHSQV